jgi:hypothetical protein
MTTVTRKTFLVQLVPAGLLVGCGGGGGDSGGSMPPPAPGSGCTASISGNHGHVLSIPTADLDSTTARTYDIQGSATHTHSVTFSAAQLAQLKSGQQVSVVTTIGDGHDHVIDERCA